VKVSSDKISRSHAITPTIEAGRVYLPEQAPWLANFLDELSAFPAAPHDDQVDALTQALNDSRSRGRTVIYELGTGIVIKDSAWARPAAYKSSAREGMVGIDWTGARFEMIEPGEIKH
jgi:hypothetical protein